MAVVANPLVLRIFINSTLNPRENGWAERWPLLSNDWNTAFAQCAEMVAARQNVLSSNAYIQWACLATVAPPYYEQTLVIDPLPALPQWGPASTDMQGIMFGFSSPLGEDTGHLFRAVEGAQIYGKEWIYAREPLAQYPPPLPADLTTAPKFLLWQNTLATFRQYVATCQPMADGHHGDGQGYWVEAFNQVYYRQVGSRYWGRPWKRMSWECWPRANAPQFSPCGCVVTVNRISYMIPARMGPGWPLVNIHYYEAKPGATVMTFRTPFCCWDRSKEYVDFSGVGEAQKYKKYNWNNGAEIGNAPGVIWTGPEIDFEGYAPFLGQPTPPGLLPACDTPTTPNAMAGVRLGLSSVSSYSVRDVAKVALEIGLLATTTTRFNENAKVGLELGVSSVTTASLKDLSTIGLDLGVSSASTFAAKSLASAGLKLGLSATTTFSQAITFLDTGLIAFNAGAVQIQLIFSPSTHAGSTLIACFLSNNAPSSTPSGWAQISATTVFSTLKLYVYKAEGAGATTTATWGLPTSSTIFGKGIEIQGLTSNLEDVASTPGTGSNASAATGSTGALATNRDAAVACVGAFNGSSTTVSAWTNSYTTQFNSWSNSLLVAMGAVAPVGTAATSTTATLTNSSSWVAQVVAFK